MTWSGALGWVAVAALLGSRWQVNLLRSRLLFLLGALCLVGYGVAERAWPVVATGLVLVLVGIGGTKLHQLQSRRDLRAFEVLEVGPQDEFLRHVLRVHGQDILAHQPGFVWDGAAPGRFAAILQHGPETIGVVLVRAEGSVAHLELDYVTPRYRNVAPGRYLFLKSGFFESRGFRRVLTPPGMRTTNYYDRLGFRQEGDHYVHDFEPAHGGG